MGFLGRYHSARKRIHGNPGGQISLNSLRELTRLQHRALENIRSRLLRQCKKTSVDNFEQINALYEECHAALKDYYIRLIAESGKLLDLDVSQFSILIMGSHARHQATPYSDLEFAILVEDEKLSFAPAKELTKLLLLFVLSIRETVLPALGIVVFNEDLKNFCSRFEELKTMSHVKHDKFFVKPPTIIMDDLYVMMKNGNCSIHKKLGFLTENNLISKILPTQPRKPFRPLIICGSPNIVFSKDTALTFPSNIPVCRRQLGS